MREKVLLRTIRMTTVKRVFSRKRKILFHPIQICSCQLIYPPISFFGMRKLRRDCERIWIGWNGISMIVKEDLDSLNLHLMAPICGFHANHAEENIFPLSWEYKVSSMNTSLNCVSHIFFVGIVFLFQNWPLVVGCNQGQGPLILQMSFFFERSRLCTSHFLFRGTTFRLDLGWQDFWIPFCVEKMSKKSYYCIESMLHQITTKELDFPAHCLQPFPQFHGRGHWTNATQMFFNYFY